MVRVILGLLLILLTGFTQVFGQGKESYRQACNQLVRMLEGKDSIHFKKAVFITENAYFNNSLNYDRFDAQIRLFAEICRRVGDQPKFTNVRNNLPYNWAIHQFITDTLPFILHGDTIKKLPYRYDTLDPTGQKEIVNTFVVKLLQTGKGNCRSLNYLYKILADELNAEAHLVLAPYHLFISHRDAPNRYNERKVYNLELTNGSFPRDGWIVAGSYITWKAMRNGLYMTDLDAKQNIALCLGDLAVSYERKFGTDDFLINLYQTAIRFFPQNPQNRVRLAECYRRVGKLSLADNLCATLVLEGYREMPDAMYEMWRTEVRKDKDALYPDTARTYAPPKDIFGNPMPTLTKGKFKEDADFTDSTRVGSVVVECATGKIIRYLKEARVYDASRFLSVDPLTATYPYYTPYQFAGNTPIVAIDIDGLEPNVNLNKNETGYANATDQVTGETDVTWKWTGSNWEEHNTDNVTIQTLSKQTEAMFNDYKSNLNKLKLEYDNIEQDVVNMGNFHPDAIQLSVGYSNFYGPGGSTSLNIVLIPQEGIDVSITGGIGGGYDTGSLSISLTTSKYVGTGSPSFDSYNGTGESIGVGYGVFSAGVSYDVSQQITQGDHSKLRMNSVKEYKGKNWVGVSTGVSIPIPVGGNNNLGIKLPVSGSWQRTQTTSFFR